MLDVHITVLNSEQLDRIEKKLDDLAKTFNQIQLDSLADSLRVFQESTESLKETRDAVENAGS